MANDHYKPSQQLKFRYNETTKDLFIVSLISVELERSESLDPREVNPSIPSGQYAITLHFDTLTSGSLPGMYIYKTEAPVKIAQNVTYQGPVYDLASKINDIRQQIAAMLSSLPVNERYFTCTVIVYAPGGNEGGQKTTTISQGGDIEIL
jgi:hypothetical protein